jgi:hypothetical protein
MDCSQKCNDIEKEYHNSNDSFVPISIRMSHYEF